MWINDDFDYDNNDNIPEGDGCPECESYNIEWNGGDTVVNVGGAATYTYVQWFTCEDCGHKWSTSEDYS